MRLTDKQKEKLATKLHHLVGDCECPETSKCWYWQLVNQKETDVISAIIKEIEKL